MDLGTESHSHADRLEFEALLKYYAPKTNSLYEVTSCYVNYIFLYKFIRYIYAAKYPHMIEEG